MRKKFEYAPGIPGYGLKGTDGSAGLTGLSLYFTQYDGIGQKEEIKGRIENNQILFGEADLLPESREYQQGDLFIDSNGRVWEIDFEHDDLFNFTGQQLETTGFFEQGRSTFEGEEEDRYQGFVNSFTLTNRFLIDIAYTDDIDPGGGITNYAANPTTEDGIYGIGATDFAQIKYVDFETNGYHPYTIWSNSRAEGEPEKTIALVKEDGKDIWRWGNVDGIGDTRDVSLALDFKDILFAGTLRGNDGPLNISNFLADASAVFTGDIHVPNPTTGTHALNMQTGDTRYLSSVAAYVREASLGSGFQWTVDGSLIVGFDFLAETATNLVLKGDIIPDVGSTYKIGDAGYTLGELYTDVLYIEDNKVIFKDEFEPTTLNVTTSRNKNIHISTTGIGISELSSAEKVLIRIKEEPSEAENFDYGIDSAGTPEDCTVTTEEWEYKEITNPVTGRTWMDRNLGADRAALSMYDEAAYGHLFQWGRPDDGHQLRDSVEQSSGNRTLDDVPCHPKFQRTRIGNQYLHENWRANGDSNTYGSNSHLWQEDTRINIPGPVNYRLPTPEEWEEEMATWESQDSYGAFKSLKLTLAGQRHPWNYTINHTGEKGFYTTSRTYGPTIWRQENIEISPTLADSSSSYYSYGESVRLIKIKGFWYKDEWWEYEEVTNPVTGRTWMDRNLGSPRPAQDFDDTGGHGDLFQWGRLDDGHQERTSTSTGALSSEDDPGHDNFIRNSNSPHDWRNPKNDNLWQGEGGINVPAPPGWRLPTESEIIEEVATWENIADKRLAAVNSILRLSAGGYRINITEETSPQIEELNSVGYYWTSDIDSTEARALRIDEPTIISGSYERGRGASVRLIKVDKDIEISNEKAGKIKFNTLGGGSSEFNTKIKSKEGFYIDGSTHFTKDSNDNLIITEKGEARTLDSIKGVRILTEDTSILNTDGGKYLRYALSTAISCKVPKDVNVPLYTPITLRQAGEGIVNITYDDASVILNGEPATNGQHTSLQIIRIEDNIWDIIGGI